MQALKRRRLQFPLFRPSLEERKEYLGKIATRVFWEKGFKTTSLQDIAQEGKVSKAGIYHYFKTKEDILSYVLLKTTDEFIGILKSSIQESEEKKLPPALAFRELIRTYARFLNKNKEKRLLVLRERHQLTGKNKRELLQRERMLFRLLMSELLRIPQLNKKYNRNVITFLIIAMSHWMGYWIREKGELSPEEIIDQNIEIIFRGIFQGYAVKPS